MTSKKATNQEGENENVTGDENIENEGQSPMKKPKRKFNQTNENTNQEAENDT
ncbi:unnamed protein product, partial [Rotaria socialis]